MAGTGASGSQDGALSLATLNSPQSAAVAASGAFALVIESGSHRLRYADLAAGAMRTLAGSGTGSVDAVGTLASFDKPSSVAIDPSSTFALIADVRSCGVSSVCALND